MFSKGMDAWERRRVGRQLGIMEDAGEVDPTTGLEEAAWSQSGPVWDEATYRAIEQRSGNWTTFALSQLGVGFRPRRETDIQIDRMYNDIFRLMTMKPNLSPEEYQNSWETDAQYLSVHGYRSVIEAWRP